MVKGFDKTLVVRLDLYQYQKSWKIHKAQKEGVKRLLGVTKKNNIQGKKNPLQCNSHHAPCSNASVRYICTRLVNKMVVDVDLLAGYGVLIFISHSIVPSR